MRQIKALCVFCGSSIGDDAAYADAGRALGKEMARQGVTLVYGGGNLGIMGALSAAVLAHDGNVVGVVPEPLDRFMKQLPGNDAHHQPVTYEAADNPNNRVIVVETMHERKALMYQLADAYVALPGGFGTWEELLEAVTHQQLGIHAKPVGLLNVNGFYDPLLAMVNKASGSGFVRATDASRLLVFGAVHDMLPGLSSAVTVPSAIKWHPEL